MRLRAPVTGGPGSVAALPAPRLLVVPALAPRFALPFLPLAGVSASFCTRTHSNMLIREHKGQCTGTCSMHRTLQLLATEKDLQAEPGLTLSLTQRPPSIILQQAGEVHCLREL